MILLIGIISLFNLTRYIFKIKKLIKMHKDNPNIQGITIVNGEVKIIEKTPQSEKKESVVSNQVIDEICGKSIEENKAYRIVYGEKEHCFCSWECREAFIKKKQEEGN
ncbi:MAG: hypothetical protein J6F30_11135 [Cellulosilyticum sp.]|nr:hypothetical protein [Cellulosilyticum sp.]